MTPHGSPGTPASLLWDACAPRTSPGPGRPPSPRWPYARSSPGSPWPLSRRRPLVGTGQVVRTWGRARGRRASLPHRYHPCDHLPQRGPGGRGPDPCAGGADGARRCGARRYRSAAARDGRGRDRSAGGDASACGSYRGHGGRDRVDARAVLHGQRAAAYDGDVPSAAGGARGAAGDHVSGGGAADDFAGERRDRGAAAAAAGDDGLQQPLGGARRAVRELHGAAERRFGGAAADASGRPGRRSRGDAAEGPASWQRQRVHVAVSGGRAARGRGGFGGPERLWASAAGGAAGVCRGGGGGAADGSGGACGGFRV